MLASEHVALVSGPTPNPNANANANPNANANANANPNPNPNPGVPCATLGHGLRGPVVEHAFWGTGAVVELLQVKDG